MIWYPYQQMKTMEEPYKIVDAEGVYLYTEDKKLIDSVSSWWSTIYAVSYTHLTARGYSALTYIYPSVAPEA